MADNFYVLEGKKLISYKPRAEHYARAIVRAFHDLGDFENSDELKKFIFLNVREFTTEKHEEKKYTYEELNNRLELMFALTDLMGRLTPIEFMQLFPIPKEYDGEKYGVKDYFSTIEEVNKYSQDKPIGDKITEFLVKYYNRDIMSFEVLKLTTISNIRRIQGQQDIMEEFAEQNGMKLQIFHQEGNKMVNDETGERYEIVKPKNPMRKLFSVV